MNTSLPDGSLETSSSDMLEAEKFDTLSELASISSQIGEGRATLTALQADTENYLMVRDLEVKARIKEVLKSSHEALVKVGQNHAELKRYHADLKGFAKVLKGLSLELTSMSEEFKQNTEETLANLDGKIEQITQEKTQNDLESETIKSDRVAIEQDRVNLENEKRAVRDQRETLARGFDELRAKQKKHG